MFTRILATTALIFGLSLPARAQAPDTIVVLDVSNSMWGQIDGVSKIEIARDVIGDLVTELPASTRIGLVAYGHREKANCADIETVLPVAPLNAAQFSSAVNALVPRGRTPLTDAVRHAAQEMGFQDTPARIILLSDGLESCDADPCALARELEAAGIDFTAHVVGFDVAAIEDQSQLSCLAEITGGQYLTAANADELAAALQTVAEPVAEPAAEPPLMQLVAVDSAGAPITDANIQWTLIDMATEDALLAGQHGSGVQTSLNDGSYLARAELNGQSGVLEFDYAQSGDAQYFEVVLSDAVTLAADSPVEPGATVTVTWTGPDATGDYLAISPAGAPISEFESYARTQQGSPLDMVAPLVAGDYEIRYISAVRGTILASIPLVVNAAVIRLSAVNEVSAASGFVVEWLGPNQPGDAIIMTPEAGAPASAVAQARTADGNPALLTAPTEPGNYQLHYLANSGEVLASIDIAVIIPATLEAPPVVPAGSEFPVTWTGPDTDNDYITIVTVGTPDNESSNHSYTRAGNPVELRAQDDAGAYELRYISGRERSVLAVLPITVSPTAATLEAAPNAASGAEIPVTWTGPDNRNDFITVVPVGTAEGENDNHTYVREGNPLTLRLPDAEGAYELRYLTGQDRNTLASLPITLTATQATLEASPTAPSGSEIAVTWTGPDNRNDFITVVPVGTAEGENDNHTYVREGNPLTLRLPDAEGAYELRYLTGQDRNTLARLPITLIKTEATIEASPIAQSGAEIPVTWTGPDNRNDFITVVPVGTAEGESDNYVYVREGNPLTLRLPEAEGAFELRYLTGQDRNTLARLPITLQAVGVTLQAEGVAVAGSEIEVTWTGPDNRNDFITIVAPDAPEGASDNYTYANEGNPLSIRTPDGPGTYEIRYLGGQDRKTLGAIALTLVSSEVTLNTVPTTVAGASVSVTWEGPDNQNDYLVIVPTGSAEDESGNFTYTREGNPLDLRTPDYAGAYEIRYISGQSRSVRAALPIILTEPIVSLAAPPSAGTDSRVELTWTGPDNQNDYIVIVPAGADEGESGNYTFTREGNPMTVRTPKEAGSYELRYISGQSRLVLASAPLRLTDIAVTLQISGDLMAAAEASVVFTGPSRDGDYLTIVPVGSPAGTYVQFYYTTGGSPGTLTLPDVAGNYELRYVSGGTAETLGQVTIEVSGIDIYLDAPEVAPAGTVLSVLWDGPDNPQDYITIVPVGAPDGSYVEYFYTSGDSPATLTTPATAGAYEIRYVSGQTGATMGSRPLTIE